MKYQEIKRGDKLKIECYKHNGYLDRTSDEATVLHYDGNVLIVANDHTKLTEHNGDSHTTNEPAVLFFFKDKWFNVIGQLKKKGLFYYCNIATPFIIDAHKIKYIDYDLDLKVFPDGNYKVLDRNEYRYHRRIMKYSEELDFILKKEMENVILMKENNIGPFDKKVNDYYYEKYLSLNV